MTIQEALRSLDVRQDRLTTAEQLHLDQEGYVRLEAILDPDALEQVRRRQAHLLEHEGERGGHETHQEPGTACLANLINKGPEFHQVLTNARVLSAVARVLDGDLKLSSLNSRNALPGHGAQGLHADWDDALLPDAFQVCNSLWLLDDFTTENGATRLVPRSHRYRQLGPDRPSEKHPDEILLLGKAGDVIVFNGYCWHGGTVNGTDRLRRVLHGYFCRRHLQQQLDQQKWLTAETWDELTVPARVVLGVTHRPADTRAG